MKIPKRRRVIEVTIKQTIGIIFLGVITLTAIFYGGVYYGENKVINAEREVQRQNEAKVLEKIKESVNTAKNSLSDQEQSNKGQLSNEFETAINQLSKNIIQNDKKSETKIPQKTDLEKKPIIEKEKTESKEIKEPEKPLIYKVKIGTFSSEENAKRIVNSIIKLGYKPEIKPDGNLFHVFVGKFDNKDDAKQFGDDLIKKLPNIEKYMIKTY